MFGCLKLTSSSDSLHTLFVFCLLLNYDWTVISDQLQTCYVRLLLNYDRTVILVSFRLIKDFFFVLGKNNNILLDFIL